MYKRIFIPYSSITCLLTILVIVCLYFMTSTPALRILVFPAFLFAALTIGFMFDEHKAHQNLLDEIEVLKKAMTEEFENKPGEA